MQNKCCPYVFDAVKPTYDDAGYLGQYVEELLLCGAEVLPFLPPDAKASLLAIARRQVCLLVIPLFAKPHCLLVA